MSEVEVKALEWRPYDSWISAETVVGRYTVRPSLATNFAGQWILSKDMETIRLFPSDAAAQAAAQADYEACIRSALVERKAEPVGWETEAEWELEQRAFAAFNDAAIPEPARKLILDLWQQYCLLAEPPTPPAAPVRVPEGWQLVPEEPTDRMISAGIIAYDGKCETSYRAMLKEAEGIAP